MTEKDRLHKIADTPSLKSVDAVIHLAAIPHPFLKGLTDDDYYDLNVKGSQLVIDACVEMEVSKFIFTSSGCVYGFWGGFSKPDKFPIDETNYVPTIAEGNSAYGISKTRVEKYIESTCDKNDWFEGYSLRVEGPGSSGTRLEWINGLHNMDERATVFTCPAYHFFAEISRINFWQIIELCLKKVLKKQVNYLVCNCGNEYIHWSINVQKWLVDNYPETPNYTTGNEALFSIKRAKEVLGYKPFPIDDFFPHRNTVESFYLNGKYTGRIGKP